MKILATLLLIFDCLLAIVSAPFVLAYTVIMFLLLFIPLCTFAFCCDGTEHDIAAVECSISFIAWPFRIWKSLLPESVRNWKL